MEQVIRVKGWDKFQHFKDRRPPWIKLYRDILDDMEFHNLSASAAKSLILIWLIASESDGHVSGDISKLAFRLRATKEETEKVLIELKSAGFLVDAAEPVDDCDGKTPAQRLREKNGFGSRHISDATKRLVWERDGGKCRACGSDENIEYDHIHPVSKGGSSEHSNIQLLCRPCNRKKRAKTAEHVATHAQPWLDIRTSETETETETEHIVTDVTPGSAKREAKQKSAITAEDMVGALPGLSIEVAKDFIAHRKAKRAALTGSAWKSIVGEVTASGWAPDAALSEAMAAGWQGVKADWLAQRKPSTTPVRAVENPLFAGCD